EHGCLERRDRRAAITRHVARGRKAGSCIAGALSQHQAHDRLGTGQELPALVEDVFVLEAYGVLWHGGFQLRASSAWAASCKSSAGANRDARVPGRRQTGSAAVPCVRAL